EQADLRALFEQRGKPDTIIQRSGENQYLIRSRLLADEQRDAQGNVIQPSERETLFAAIRERFGNFQTLDFNTVSPTIAAETVRNAALAVTASSIAILFYIWWAFRQVPNPFRYGVCALIALLHDVLVVLGLFSILGKLFNVEVDSLFITAMLTVIGFSVHDTIVVFDRIRENLRRHGNLPLAEVVNHSILQTISRSLNTTITVVLTLLALLLFGGAPTRTFVLALLIGIVSGTYSSIFNAAQLLVVWESGELRRFFGRGRKQPDQEPATA
ncbi:MAG: protein translocase subunit SecF, partial [Dehalococcoidia bacterium]|nr:protein translocase subunit SecF [Dehalococcoidia bacterium]